MNNMYPEYEGKTINFIIGECPHNCTYCYVKSFRFPFLKERYSGKQRLDEAVFKKNLGKDKMWFVCSCNDINTVPIEWEKRILNHLRDNYPDNTYLIQSKDPSRFNFIDDSEFPPKTILGTTIETNIYSITDKLSKAPTPADRFEAMCKISFPKMVSIEPILDFDLDAMVVFMELIKPKYVSIGADSKYHNLPKPTPEKINALITELRKFTEVKIKKNLNRLIKGSRGGEING